MAIRWLLEEVWWKMCLKKKLYFWKTKIYIWMMFDLYKYVFIDLSAKKKRRSEKVWNTFFGHT